ncbi:lipopolysaccharide biosynthesis protein [Bacteroidia bacterium]|nr:lipopolysaccharide biosynthesis protein [Bacteroidia bacterium]GHV70295.1 lipopolysaccharide biosynthesis protein [Bacteroidia bacterium]
MVNFYNIISKNNYLSSMYVRIKNSDIGMRMAKGVFWSLAGTSIAKFIILVAGIVCARILGKEQYGEFGMVRSTINMFVVFGSVGLGLTASKYISEYREKDKQKVSSIYVLTNGFSIITGTTITILVLIFAPFLAEKTLNAPYLSDDIRVGGLLLFVTIVNSAQNGMLSGFEDFRSIAINTFIASIAETLFMLIGAYYYSVLGAIWGFGIGYLVLAVANYVSIKKNIIKFTIPNKLKYFNKKDLRILYKFSLPAALSSIMVAPVFWIIRAMLVKSAGFGEAGLYEIADQWKIIILFIPGAISQMLMPILSSTKASESESTYWRVLKYNIGINVIVTFVLAIIVSIYSSIIMQLYGKNFESTMAIIILAYSTVFTSISTVFGTSIASFGKMWIGFCFNLLWAMIIVGFTYIFLHQGMGAVGLALAVLCSYVIHTIMQFFYIFHLAKSRQALKSKLVIF